MKPKASKSRIAAISYGMVGLIMFIVANMVMFSSLEIITVNTAENVITIAEGVYVVILIVGGVYYAIKINIIKHKNLEHVPEIHAKKISGPLNKIVYVATVAAVFGFIILADIVWSVTISELEVWTPMQTYIDVAITDFCILFLFNLIIWIVNSQKLKVR